MASFAALPCGDPSHSGSNSPATELYFRQHCQLRKEMKYPVYPKMGESYSVHIAGAKAAAPKRSFPSTNDYAPRCNNPTLKPTTQKLVNRDADLGYHPYRYCFDAGYASIDAGDATAIKPTPSQGKSVGPAVSQLLGGTEVGQEAVDPDLKQIGDKLTAMRARLSAIRENNNNKSTTVRSTGVRKPIKFVKTVETPSELPISAWAKTQQEEEIVAQQQALQDHYKQLKDFRNPPPHSPSSRDPIVREAPRRKTAIKSNDLSHGTREARPLRATVESTVISAAVDKVAKASPPAQVPPTSPARRQTVEVPKDQEAVKSAKTLPCQPTEPAPPKLTSGGRSTLDKHGDVEGRDGTDMAWTYVSKPEAEEEWEFL